MRVLLGRGFQKDIARVPRRVQVATKRRLKLFLEDPRHPLLNYHQLRGKFADYMSINVAGDYRLIFSIDTDALVLYRIGTHAQLYK